MKKLLCLIALFVCLASPAAYAQFASGLSKSTSSVRPKVKVTKEYKRGYKGFVELGYSAGSIEHYDDDYGYESEPRVQASLYTSHGYQFNPWIYLGAGAGMEFSREIYMPIFADFRVNLNNPNKHKCTPYLGTCLGGTVFAYTEYCQGEGGVYFDLSLGLRIALPKNALHMSMGYQLMSIASSYEYSYYEGGYGVPEPGHRFSFRLGYEF